MDIAFLSQAAMAVFSGLMSLFVGWYGYRLKLREDKRQEQEREKEEAAKREANELRAKTDAVSLGLQSLLRNSIIKLHDNCLKDGRQKTYYDAQNMEYMYIAYHGLGGNGMVTEIYDDFRNFKLITTQE